jgi:hypothetical protein
MDASLTLTSPTAVESPEATTCCPRCEEPSAGTPVPVSLFEGGGLLRCRRCGARYATDGTGRVVAECGDCGLPFLDAAGAREEPPCCPDCTGESSVAELPDAPLGAATEREVRLALEARWRFVTSEPSSVYLDKVVRQVARCIEGAPRDCRVALFEDDALRTLALPSGTILVSHGTLAELQDEAQLAFVLGHELAHAASRAAAASMVRLGLRAVSGGAEAVDEAAWADGAEDLIRLGLGRRREREADERALAALIELGYDPAAAQSYLRRIVELDEARDPRVAELTLAHPSARDRLQRVGSLLQRRIGTGTGQVNREVFRRVAGRHAGSVEKAPLNRIAEPAAQTGEGTDTPARRSLLPWIGLAAALLAALAILLVLAL